jgi:hypothetical protein
MNAAMLCIEAASLVPRQRPRSRLPDSSADAADALHDSDLAWSPRTSRRPVKSSAHQLMRGECRAGALPLPEHQVRDVDEYIKCGMNLHDEDLLQNHRCAHDPRVLSYCGKHENCAVAAVCARIPHDTSKAPSRPFIDNCAVAAVCARIPHDCMAPKDGGSSAHLRLSMIPAQTSPMLCMAAI